MKGFSVLAWVRLMMALLPAEVGSDDGENFFLPSPGFEPHQ